VHRIWSTRLSILKLSAGRVDFVRVIRSIAAFPYDPAVRCPSFDPAAADRLLYDVAQWSGTRS
jgi:hypothetical protein